MVIVMKNMRVSSKLMLGFMITVLLTALVGAGSIFGTVVMRNTSADLYENKAKPLGDLAKAEASFQNLRVQARNAVIHAEKNSELVNIDSEINKYVTIFESNMAAYKDTITSEEGLVLYSNIMEQYEKTFKPCILTVIATAKETNSQDKTFNAMLVTKEITEEISEELTELIDARMKVMSESNTNLGNSAKMVFLINITVMAVAVVTALMLAFYISRLISTPISILTDYMKAAESTGNLELRQVDKENLAKYGTSNDETGHCLRSIAGFIGRQTEIAHTLEVLAGGDLTPDIPLLSEYDVMGKSLKTMTVSLNRMFSEINVCAGQVSTGAKQLADGSQELAQGSAEQSETIERLSNAVTDIEQRTTSNSEIAEKTAKLAATIRTNAETGTRQMEQMMEAVKEINQSSQDIGKVIKVIDDIAFQTNILALNAAVEAARAGQHGKGFAVVAEEVRNLAAKSANAAKDTGGLISSSIEKAEFGARIANETASSLAEIVDGISESNALIETIADLSNEQADAITHLRLGIDQVVKVIQQNSANAEESSAASEEMSGQAYALEGLISRFKLRAGEDSELLSGDYAADVSVTGVNLLR